MPGLMPIDCWTCSFMRWLYYCVHSSCNSNVSLSMACIGLWSFLQVVQDASHAAAKKGMINVLPDWTSLPNQRNRSFYHNDYDQRLTIGPSNLCLPEFGPTTQDNYVVPKTYSMRCWGQTELRRTEAAVLSSLLRREMTTPQDFEDLLQRNMAINCGLNYYSMAHFMASIAANTSAKLSRLPQKASRDSFILTLKKVQLTIMDILISLRANDSNNISSQVTAVPEADIDAKEMTRLLPCLVNDLTQSRDRSAQINILGVVRECIEQYLTGAAEDYDHKEHFDANLCHSHWGCLYILYSVWNTDPLLYYWAWAWDTIQSAAFQIYAPWSYVSAYTINWYHYQILQDFQENPVANVSAP